MTSDELLTLTLGCEHYDAGGRSETDLVVSAQLDTVVCVGAEFFHFVHVVSGEVDVGFMLGRGRAPLSSLGARHLGL